MCREGHVTGQTALFSSSDDEFHLSAAVHAATVHLDNTLEDYRREIQRRVFGDAGRPGGDIAP
jgi:GntR family transcriptional regulator, transcriptional repressor for pyruvate dehydrogenase complex